MENTESGELETGADDLWERGCTWLAGGQGRAGGKDQVMVLLCPAATMVRQAAMQFLRDLSSERGPVSQRTRQQALVKAQEWKTQAGGLPGSWRLAQKTCLVDKDLYPMLNRSALTQGSLVSSLSAALLRNQRP